MEVFFSDYPHEVERWIRAEYGEEIDKKDEDVKRKLYNGYTANWNTFMGQEATQNLIDKLTETYANRLFKTGNMPAHLTKVPYDELSPAEKRNYKRIEKKLKAQTSGPSEKEWVKNNFDKLMFLVSNSGARGDAGFNTTADRDLVRTMRAGFFGRMSDWWLGRGGIGMFERSLKNNVLDRL